MFGRYFWCVCATSMRFVGTVQPWLPPLEILRRKVTALSYRVGPYRAGHERGFLVDLFNTLPRRLRSGRSSFRGRGPSQFSSGFVN